MDYPVELFGGPCNGQHHTVDRLHPTILVAAPAGEEQAVASWETPDPIAVIAPQGVMYKRVPPLVWDGRHVYVYDRRTP